MQYYKRTLFCRAHTKKERLNMKVIINGRKYDTETARLLGEVMNEECLHRLPGF